MTVVRCQNRIRPTECWKVAQVGNTHRLTRTSTLYRVSIRSSPDTNIYYKKTTWNTKGARVEVYKYVIKKLLELSYISKKKYVCIPRGFLVVNVCNQEKTLCSPCILETNLSLRCINTSIPHPVCFPASEKPGDGWRPRLMPRSTLFNQNQNIDVYQYIDSQSELHGQFRPLYLKMNISCWKKWKRRELKKSCQIIRNCENKGLKMSIKEQSRG
jgi:hypothetical protein